MAGYSGTPLVNKIGIKAGQRVMFVNEPPHFQKLLGRLPILGKISDEGLDVIILFVRSLTDLRDMFPRAQQGLAAKGMLWVGWPKKSSGVKTDLDENVIRDFGLKQGLVDVKVCAIDETWSGLKFVVRKAGA
jgi:Protein of unknown function (DUF3052)